MGSRRVGYYIVAATVALIVVLLTVEFIVYIQHLIKVSHCFVSGHHDEAGATKNSSRDKADNLNARLARMDSMCKKYAPLLCEDPNDQSTIINHLYCGNGASSFYLIQSHRFGYCAIPKAATSSLKTLLLEAEGIEHPEDNADQIFFEFYSRFPPVNPSNNLAKKLGSGYTKLIVVRHPFDRLVSAYVDKIRTTRPFITAAKNMYKDGFVG